MEDFKSGRGFNPQQLKQYTGTKDGLAWLIKHLHPPGPDPKPAGLPDRDCQMSAVTDYDIMESITPPTGTGNWSAAVYSLPHIEVLAIVFKWRDSSPDIITTQIITNPKLNITFPNLVAGEQISDILVAMRGIAKSSTVHLNCNSLSNQGMVYACQLRGGRTNYPGAPQSYVRSTINVGHLAQNGGDVTMSTAKPYVGAAKDGSYIPNGFIQATQPYIPVVVDIPLQEGTTKEASVPFLTYNREVDGVDTSYEVRLVTSGDRTVPFDDLSVGLHLYVGLDPTASLTIRSVLFHEVVPSFRSKWVPFQTPGATPDSMAVDNAYIIRQLMPDAFPESANFWGALAGLASTILPSLVGWAVPKLTAWLGSKSTPAAAAPKAAAPAQIHVAPAPPKPKNPPKPAAPPRGRSTTRRAKSANAKATAV